MATKTVYIRIKAQILGDGKYLPDSTAPWQYVPVAGSEDRGKRPAWQVDAEKAAAAKTGRGFQYRLPNRAFSEQFDTIAAAEAAEGKQESSVAGPESSPDNANRKSIKATIDTYLARKQGKRNASSLRNYTFILNEFLTQLPRHIRFIDQIEDRGSDPDSDARSSQVLEHYWQYLQKAGAAPKTVQNKMLVVCFMLKSAGIPKPSKLIELPTLDEEPVIPYESDELKKLFNVMSPDEAFAFEFFLSTACRESEVAHAQWQDIDWKKSEFIVRPKSWVAPNGLTKTFTVKNHEARRVPITRDVLAELKARHAKATSPWIFPNRDGQPEGHFLRDFKRAAFEADLNCGHCKTIHRKGSYDNRKAVEVSCSTDAQACSKHYLHRLRKTRATLWQENQVPIRTVQHWLGHKSLETTMGYLAITDSKKLQDEINVPLF